MRIAAIGPVRIVEQSRGILQQRPVAEWRGRCVDVVIIGAREGVRDAVRRAYRKTPVTADVPPDADARGQIPPLRGDAGASLRETRIAGPEESGRRGPFNRALPPVLPS